MGEIMYPGHGGTGIPFIAEEKKEVPLEDSELPQIRKSPRTIAALRWCYNDDLPSEKGRPVHCEKCKALGWLWK